MSNPIISKLETRKTEIEAFVGDLLQKAETEQRDLSESELRNLEMHKAEMGDLNKQLEPLIAFEEARSVSTELANRSVVAQRSTDISKAEKAVVTNERRTLGQILVRSDEYIQSAGGPMRRPVEVDAAPSQFLTRDSFGLADEPINTTEPIGSLFVSQPQKLMLDGGRGLFALVDSIRKMAVTGNSVEAVVAGSPDGARTPGWVDEPNSSSITAKPYVEVAATTETFNLRQLAALLKITKIMLEDSNYIRSFVDQELLKGLRREINTEIANVLKAGTYDDVTGDSYLEAIRNAIGCVESKGYQAEYLIGNPADLALIDMEMAAALGGLSALPYQSRPWGLGVVVDPLIPAGEVYVGEWSSAMVLFERNRATVEISDSNVDDWEKNLYTLRAEVRVAPAVLNPNAICHGTVTVTP